MARKSSKRKSAGQGRPFDYEALGLVLLGVGIFLLAMLLPVLPTGELGRGFRRLVVGRIGAGAYLLPWPPLLVGGLFLMRRTLPTWPRVIGGYAVAGAGLWLLVMLMVPGSSGSWGQALRTLVTGATGWLAYLAALLVVSVGLELIFAWPPTSLARRALRWLLETAQTLWHRAAKTRRELRTRAAFYADVALVRRELRQLGDDLVVLSELYTSSAELSRWQKALGELSGRLEHPKPATLHEAQQSVSAWQRAVGEFTDRAAAELSAQIEAEEDAPEAFERWAQAIGAGLEPPIDEPVRIARPLDDVRKTLLLDLTALTEAHRQLRRERELARSALQDATPRRLSDALSAHQERLSVYHQLGEGRAGLDQDAALLRPWRELSAEFLYLTETYTSSDEIRDYGSSLAGELRDQGRALLAEIDPWRERLARAVARAKKPAAGQVETLEGGLPDPPEADGTDPADIDPVDTESSPAAAVHGPDEDAGEDVDANADEDADKDAGAAPLPEPSDPPEAGWQPELRAEHAPEKALEPPEVGGISIRIPSTELLDDPPQRSNLAAQADEVRARETKINETLESFRLQGRVVASVRGPSVTRVELEPAPGEKISRYANLSDDLALALAVGGVRIEAPIPGKSVIGLEVPNAIRDLVPFREAAESYSFKRSKARLPLILGKSIDGEMIVGDLAGMPHLLIAGSTGAGKSVAVNTLIGSLLFRFLPTELRLLMIDPKMVELTPFDGVPHLLRPVVTAPDEASGVLLGAVAHMERRYKMMRKLGVKTLDQYNRKAKTLDMAELPFLVIVVDELADLMMTSPKEVEGAVMRLAQMARATGMHLVLATQRPSVDILTNSIKVNIPARMAFAVSSGHDSRTILNSLGAESLTGMGDMLFYQPGRSKPVRLQGPYISEEEILQLTEFLCRQYFDDDFVEAYGSDFDPVPTDDSAASGLIDWDDDKLRDAAELVVNEGQASVSRLQRRLSVGHARAGKLMDSLEAMAIVGGYQGSKPRDVLVAAEDLPDIFGS
ncbi:MAG: DNA translocase FtsK [Trueperaceae bacterium]|nr:DNA translocase FtsK [Trueperaceae bacterium]